VHHEHLKRREDNGADVLTLLDQGRLIRGSDYVDAQSCGGFIAANFRSCGARSIAFHAGDADTGAEDRPDEDAGRRDRRRRAIGDDAADARDQRARDSGTVDSVRVYESGLPIGLQIPRCAAGEEMICAGGGRMRMLPRWSGGGVINIAWTT